MKEIKFRFFCPPAKGFVQDYKFSGLIKELFEKDPLLIPSQCTGLKDKNGKEVFEGDIIEIGENGFREKKTAVIDFLYGAFVAKFIGAQGTMNFMFLYQIGLFEVVGNKFENPELLQNAPPDI